MWVSFVKIWRYFLLYGLGRTYIKVIGRLRYGLFNFQIRKKKKRYISIVGCGQFSFSTICFFLYKLLGNVFLGCFDINLDNASTLARFHKFRYKTNSFEDLISDHEMKILYIASNHYSHTEYALKALEKGKIVYIEKPLSISYDQFIELLKAEEKSCGNVFAGYNRPYSKAVEILKRNIKHNKSAFTLGCYINGHVISKDHWYRDEKEGTRICGNVGHWLDLSVHLLNFRSTMPEMFRIRITYSNKEVPDDNINITYSTDYGDIVSITITSRTEPFEGISEIINFQNDEVIAKIDDFRKMVLWKGAKKLSKRFWPKDVGHKKAISQPFIKNTREWKEVELSTILMLHITDMVKSGEEMSDFNLVKKHSELMKIVKCDR